MANKHSPGCKCCATTTTPPCATYCVTVLSSCGGNITGAVVTLTAKQVTSVTITNGGTGYTSAPAVAFGSGTFGGGAAATAIISGGTVTSISVTAPGAYTSTPAVTFSGGGGAGAAATAVMATNTIGTCATSGQVVGVTMTNNGANYTVAPPVAFTGGGGSGAAGTANLGLGSVSGVTVTAAGTGYTTAPTVVFTGGGGVLAAARALLAGTTVASLALTAGGTSYSSLPTVTFGTPTGHTGSGAAASPTLGVNSIVSVGSGGSGYAVGNVLTVAGGTSGTAATLTVTAVSGGVVTAASVTTPGAYTALPANPAAVTGGAGSGATFNLRYRVVGLTLSSPGTNYSTAPTVGISGGGGAGATATATLAPSVVASVTVTAPGSSYTSAPAVSFTTPAGYAGGGAAATAAVKFKVASVTITSGGSGYTSAPTVAFTGGDGSGAAATSIIGVRCCIGIFYGGAYTVGASASLHTTGSAPQGSVPGCTNVTTSITLARNQTDLCAAVGSCVAPLAGEDVTVVQGGVTIASGTTAGASPNFCTTGAVAATTYSSNFTRHAPARFAPGSITHTPSSGCAPDNVTIPAVAAPGYVCYKPGCDYPFSKTLFLSDPAFGPCTLIYGTAGSAYGGPGGGTYPANGWLGATSASFLGCAGLGCAAKPGVLVAYFIGNDNNPLAGIGDPTALGFSRVSFSANNVTNCPDTFPAATIKGPISGTLFRAACPPSLLFTATYSFGDGGLNGLDKLYCLQNPGDSVTLTVTE